MSIPRFPGRHAHLEEPCGVEPAHRRDAIRARDARRGRLGMERPDADLVAVSARTEQFVRVAQTTGEHLLHRRLEVGRDRVVDRHWLTPRSRKRSGMAAHAGRWPSSYPIS